MEAIKALIPVLIAASLWGLVFAGGLNASPRDLSYVLRHPAQLLRGILAVVVAPPILAGIVVSMLPISPVVKAAIMLMAISPVPPFVPGNELAVGGRKEYAYGLYVALTLLTLVSVPIVFTIASQMFGRQDSVSAASIARTVFFGVILPLSLGALVRHIAPAFAERTWSLIYKLSLALVAVAIIPVLIGSYSALLELVGNGTLLAMGLLTMACLAVGHALGGPDRRDRAALAMAASIRHPGIAMGIASASFGDPRVNTGILLFVLWGVVISFPYKVWVKRSHSHQPEHA